MIYSPYKAAHHIGRIETIREGKLIWPTQIQIDLTNNCNHNCPYCFYRCTKGKHLNALFDESDSIPTERVIALLLELKNHDVSIQYTGGGEPSTHPSFYRIIQTTIELGIPFALVTNGADILFEQAELLKKADWVRVSLDAANRDTYSRSQGSDKEDFARALNFIDSLTGKGPVVGVSFVVNPINYKEIIAAANLARNLGADNIRYSIAYTTRGVHLFKDKWDTISLLSKAARDFETKDFKVFDLSKAHLENLDLKQKGYNFCGYQHFTAVIGADQKVYPCCTLKYNNVSNLGSIEKKSFSDVWFGKDRKRWLNKNHLKNICDKNPCWMDKKNEFISYLVCKDPAHKNYI